MSVVLEEEELVVRLKAGDEAAFETLVRTHGPRMLAVARRYLSREADAQDALQDAFVNVVRAIGSFAGNSRLSTWLHRVVVNSALMKIRSARRQPVEAMDTAVIQQIADRAGTGGGSRIRVASALS